MGSDSERIAALEAQVHWLHMQIEKMSNLFATVQVHELQLYRIEHPQEPQDASESTVTDEGIGRYGS